MTGVPLRSSNITRATIFQNIDMHVSIMRVLVHTAVGSNTRATSQCAAMHNTLANAINK